MYFTPTLPPCRVLRVGSLPGSRSAGLEVMGFARSCALLGGTFALLLVGSIDAFALLRPSVAGPDLGVIYPLSAAAFWQLACSRKFYFSTRYPTKNVRQKVLELTDWNLPEGSSKTMEEAASPSAGGGFTLPPPCQTPPEEYFQYPQEHQHQQLEQQQLRREARLTYVISSPIGSSNAMAVQEQTLRVQDGGAICFSHSDCIVGFPLIPGDLNITATYTITPIQGGEIPGESVCVRVGVTVGDINFPPPFGAIEPMVAGIVEKDVQKQATKWLQEMTEANLQEFIN